MSSPFLETPIAVRAFTMPEGEPLAQKRGASNFPLLSGWEVIFDAETTRCPAQKLRAGFAQIRDSGRLVAEVIFVADDLPEADLEVIRSYAKVHNLEVLTLARFNKDVVIDLCYRANGTLVGFNLPFDISRIAIEWGEARGNMRGGFSFKLTRYKSEPAIRVKHLSSTAALIDWAAPGKQMTGRGMRNRDMEVPLNRGSFVDLRTLASALLTGKHSLRSLAEKLKTKTQKLETSDHGETLSFAYLDYARADVQTTWECYQGLAKRYAEFGLSTSIGRILSEASLGKALLDKMGIRPLLSDGWAKVDLANFGRLIATYYGGRAEVHFRREPTEVIHTDFKSMYPTVNALLGLHRFLTADGYETYDATDEVRQFLESLTLDQMQDKATWQKLIAIVELVPADDLVPVRAPYSGEGKPHTIGLNHLSAEFPVWYALPDLAVSVLSTGELPRIVRAIGFKPGAKQRGMSAINLMGRADCVLDPAAADMFTGIINMRDRAKAAKDPIEKHLKILANSTGYGVYAEIIRDDAPKPEPLTVYGPDGASFTNLSCALEEPGRYYHPLLAAMITSAARLMLACAELVAEKEGLGWAFCDTDSLAIAKPVGMPREEFETRVRRVIDWFGPLNPYEKPGSILQIEDVNLDAITGELTPLYCLAISAKRYALFNIDASGRPVIRKASAHGLGHLMDPYDENDPASGIPAPVCDLSKIGVKRWQYDLWYHIIQSALDGNPNQVRLDYHPKLSEPALMRYGATSPALLRWMGKYNEDKGYSDQVKPFGFMVAPTAKGEALCEPVIEAVDAIQRGRPAKRKIPKPIAPFERDPALVAGMAFDRETGKPVPLSELKSYADVLRFYHLSPEEKFENGGPWDRGLTRRRLVVATGVVLIGKEANKVGEFGEGDPLIGAVAKLR